MGKHRGILLIIALSVLTCVLSAEETVSLRRITGAELKYLYEFPTLRAIDDKTDEGIDEKFERCPGLSFIIVDNATSKALTNDFLKNEAATKTVAGTDVITSNTDGVINLDHPTFESIRFSIIRERTDGSTVKKSAPTVYPMSILYVNHGNQNTSPVDMKAEYNGAIYFNSAVTTVSHPWISYDKEDSDVFKLHMNENSKSYHIQYYKNPNNDDEYF